MLEVTPGPGWWRDDDGAWRAPRWEYRTITGTDLSKHTGAKLFAELEAAGLDGWEAVTFAQNISSIRVLLKRPIVG